MSRLCVYCSLTLLAMLAGCTRSHYRLRADADSYSILQEKAGSSPWAPPSNYGIEPHPASRFYDPTPTDDPYLPIPSPQLYAYQLPELRSAEASRFQGVEPGYDDAPLIDPVVRAPPGNLRFIRLPPVNEGRMVTRPDPPADFNARRASFETNTELRRVNAQPGVLRTDDTYSEEALVVPIPPSAWEDIPLSCRRRMYDFESLRGEYELTFVRPISESDLLPAPRLTLEDIIDLALIDSREYQLQKELLYRVALDLSLQQFAYDLKFSADGNRVTPSLNHDREGGLTENTLRIPSTLQADKMMLTGGDLLARFANDVVLTFNGPGGFAADVGSTLLFDMSQSILQHDIRLEALTQSERDVVYAARDFARFRKELFTNLATRYYNLLRTYRQVEINSQNYFAFVRLFNQAEAEYRAGFVPLFEVDQVEQQVLGGRRGLINTCNDLEQALDNLKLSIGLPTEMSVNVSLSELERLTAGDELSVRGALIQRESNRLRAERREETPNRVVLLTAGIELIERILEVFALQARQGEPQSGGEALRETQAAMVVESVRVAALDQRQRVGEVEPARHADVVLQTLNLVDILLEMNGRQIELGEHRGLPRERLDGFSRQQATFVGEADRLRALYRSVIDQPAALAALVDRTQDLLAQVEIAVEAADQAVGNPRVAPPPDLALQDTLQATDPLLDYADTVRGGIRSGLIPIDITVNDAMMTALVLRFELMNERGILADQWRQIKLAGDDLKSVMDLNASHTIRTRTDVNRVFDFTFDESNTQLRLTFDAPLNRRAQRNSFRRALINYNVAIRRLMQIEDNIKLDVRSDLRGLALSQEQYTINVASAALASKQVASTTQEFRLGLESVRATDILRAQNRYTLALSQAARTRIDYIIGRMRLFLDLELMTVGDDGFWRELYDEEYQPEPYYQLPPEAMPAYGELPHLLYSKKIRRMEQVPVGVSAVHEGDQAELVPLGEPAIPESPAEPEPVVY